MDLAEYVRLDALAMAQRVKGGEATALEMLACALALQAEMRGALNALAVVDGAKGREKAGQVSQGVFQGVPFLVKELLAYPGLRTAMGSRLLSGHVPNVSTPYTQRLDASGLVVFGNTASSEFGLLGSTETMLHGVTRNPWNLEYSAGGSSGGSAAAVAAGIVPFAHASDAGGSIRVPASVCGLFGFKPSAGRCVPAGEGDGLLDLVSEHCLSRTVRDSAALLAVTEASGADARFSPIGFCSAPVKRRLRIGCYTRTLMGEHAAAEVTVALTNAVELCRGLGHEVLEDAGPDIDGAAVSDAFFTLAGKAMTDLASAIEPMLGRAPGKAELEPFTLALMTRYRTRGTEAMERAMAALRREAAKMLAHAERFDVLLCPTLAGTPKPVGFLSPTLGFEELVSRTESYLGYTPIHNMCGMPAMSVPLSISPEGLPLGSHFAARPGEDALLLGLAYELEQAAPWVQRLPLWRR